MSKFFETALCVILVSTLVDANVIHMSADKEWVPLVKAQPVTKQQSNFISVEDLKTEYNKFKEDFSKVYSDIKEESMRFRTFAKNLFHIFRHNAAFNSGNYTYKLGVNQFADQTEEEMKQYRGYRSSKSKKDPNGSLYLSPAISIKLPGAVDWRTKGAVTDVKNQGHCGSCWTFSATGSIEGQHFLKTGRLVSLSEQQIVDCCHLDMCNGCHGGLMDTAFQYIKENSGDDTETSYPYVSGSTGKRNNFCRFNTTSVGAKVTGFVDIPADMEDKLQEAVALKGPISVAIDASDRNFMLYHSGVYESVSCSSVRLDHGVLAVGYGTDADTSTPYWLVKNSWGPTWGDQGYIKMRRNKNNMCGIASKASYPLV